ncbi:hypothetical protein X474_06290 [Dethiosulfatarculus sandiegensis]|uniref:Uncharacterized protein n=1 Tax=Dethiosulfatarculus sandiegensis TaxID=1429043 RepID=A0A0D2GIW0_9BACT|nr:hypothetical protein X474_06290 [Dethiosulfatarculus sandiegensis]
MVPARGLKNQELKTIPGLFQGAGRSQLAKNALLGGSLLPCTATLGNKQAVSV